MKHFLIFRFCGQDIKNLLNENERTLLGGYGEIYEGRILVPDERIEVLKLFFKEQTNKNNFIRTENFISSAWYEFHYTKSELDSVKILRIIPTRTIMICGEECGTEYDYSGCCPECNSGRKLISYLNIHKSRLPKSADWIRTYAGETIVTEILVNCFVDYNLAGMNYIQMILLGIFIQSSKKNLRYQVIRKSMFIHCIQNFGTDIFLLMAHLYDVKNVVLFVEMYWRKHRLSTRIQ